MITNNECTGCGACSLVCPQKCITMQENRFGEISPRINTKSCTNCGLCSRICPQNNTPPLNSSMACFAAWSKEPSDWIYSASGGVANAFSSYILENQGIVFGCDYDQYGNLMHFCVVDKSNLKRLQSSKYSQSSAYICFHEIKQRLENEEKVLFIGTPCQVAGLLKYLKKDYPSLYTIDLICHGTPPTQYLQEYLRGKHLLPAEKIRFRGEYDQQFTVWKDNKICYQNSNKDDLYFASFYNNTISRKSCYFCQYAQDKRIADITIGDYWGLGDLYSLSKYSNRPSLILINTQKGKTLFDSAKENLFFEQREIQEAVSGNGRLKNPPGQNTDALYFRTLYPLFGFSFSAKIAPVLSKIRKIVKHFLNFKK